MSAGKPIAPVAAPALPAAPPPRIIVRHAPLVLAAVMVCAGVVAARYLPLAMGIWLTLAAAGWGVGLLTFRRPDLGPITMLALAVAIFSLSGAWTNWRFRYLPERHVVTFCDDAPVLATLRGQVLTPPVEQPSSPAYWMPPKLSFAVEAQGLLDRHGQWQPTEGVVRVSVECPPPMNSAWRLPRWPMENVTPGRQVELVGTLRRFGPPGNPGQFDWQREGRYRGEMARLSLPCPDAINLLPSDDAGLTGPARGLRLAARRHMLSLGQTGDATLLDALVLGERMPALRTLNQAMVEAGTAHYLSISGAHLAIFLGFVYAIARLLMLSPRRSAILLIALLVLYLFLAEPNAPLLRSAIMAGALCVAAVSGRSISNLNALAGACVLLLALDPLQLFTAGFQLSFGIVLGLLLLTGPIRQRLFGTYLRRRGLIVYRRDARVRRWLAHRGADWAMTLVAASLAAATVSIPLVAYHFGLFSPYAPVLSILLAPFMMFVLVPAYVSLALAWPMPNVAAQVGELAASAASLLRGACLAARDLPGLSVDLFVVPAWLVVLAYVVVAAWLVSGRWRGGIIAAAAMTVALVGGAALTQWPASPPPAGALHVLDVAQGSLTLYHSPAGKTYLFDAGTLGSDDAGRQILRPFLRHMRLPSPRAVFISHPNIDHYNILAEMLDRAPPSEVYLNPYFGTAAPAGSAVDNLVRRLKAGGVSIHRLSAGQVVRLDDRTVVEALWPGQQLQPLATAPAASPAEDRARGRFENDSSLVLRVRSGGRSLLLPGDVEETAQAELLKLPPGTLSADVLVLPHHGSPLSTLGPLIQAVAPAVVVQSNSYRGENARLIEALGGRKRFATFRDGWICVSLDEALSVQTMRSGQWSPNSPER